MVGPVEKKRLLDWQLSREDQYHDWAGGAWSHASPNELECRRQQAEHRCDVHQRLSASPQA